STSWAGVVRSAATYTAAPGMTPLVARQADDAAASVTREVIHLDLIARSVPRAAWREGLMRRSSLHRGQGTEITTGGFLRRMSNNGEAPSLIGCALRSSALEKRSMRLPRRLVGSPIEILFLACVATGCSSGNSSGGGAHPGAGGASQPPGAGAPGGSGSGGTAGQAGSGGNGGASGTGGEA